MKRLVTLFLILALYSFMLSSAIADSDSANPVMNDKFTVYLGGFFPEVDSSVRVDGDILGPGDNIDFEKTLGLEESKTLLWGGIGWQISRRNSLEFEFANLNRDGFVQAISDPIQIEDNLVQAGAALDTAFDVTLGRLTYGFSIIKDEKKDLRLKAGLHIADLGVSFQATGVVCVDGEPLPCTSFTSDFLESEDVTAPLPHFGGEFSYAFSPKLMARLQVIGFAIELDSIDGSLIEVDADLVWSPWRHFGLGAGLRYFNANLESKGSKLNGEFDFDYYGPAIFGIFTF
jgi:hypothetical protein